MAKGQGGTKMKRSSPQSQELLDEIRTVSWGDAWLRTPHDLLGGETPEQKIMSGDTDSVRNLFESILYIGIT